MAWRHLLIGTCVAATLLAGCGDDAEKRVDTAQIRSVVSQFAMSSDAHACDLLSPDALVNVYGGFSKSPEQSHAECVRRSVKFTGQPVRITVLKVLDSETARVSALSPSGRVTYTLTLRKFGPSWRIDEINQSKTEQ
jgi:hypothetical protein